MAQERRDVGKALISEDEGRLYSACSASRSPALLPLFVLCVDAGLRSSEAKMLRRKDLCLEWQDGKIVSGELIVAESKTEAGTGRRIPLTRRACAVLALWFSNFPDAPTEGFV